MARRKNRGTKKRRTRVTDREYKPTRNWRKLFLQIFSVTIVVSMVAALFVGLLAGTGGGPAF